MTDQEYEKIKSELKKMDRTEKKEFWDKAGDGMKWEYQMQNDVRFEQKRNKLLLILCTIIAACFGMAIIASVISGGGSSGSGSRTCGSCGRSFSDSANVSSIKRTNMCSNCYHNYHVAVNTKDKLEY